MVDPCFRSTRTLWSTLQPLTEDLIGQLGISLATGLLHELTDKEALELFLATTEGFHLGGMRRQQLLNDGGDRRRVTDHAEATLIHDRLG